MIGLNRNTQNNARKHFLFLLFFIFTFCYSNAQQARDQWSEEKAWEWQKEIGIIKGFNQPVEAYPGMFVPLLSKLMKVRDINIYLLGPQMKLCA